MSREAAAMAERNEERRESPRVPMRLHVRRVGGGADYEAREGDVSLGGFAWHGGPLHGGPLEVGEQVEVRLTLPGAGAELHGRGEVLQVTEGPQGPHPHARFVELSMEAERAIARYLDDVALAGPRR